MGGGGEGEADELSMASFLAAAKLLSRWSSSFFGKLGIFQLGNRSVGH